MAYLSMPTQICFGTGRSRVFRDEHKIQHAVAGRGMTKSVWHAVSAHTPDDQMRCAKKSTTSSYTQQQGVRLRARHHAIDRYPSAQRAAARSSDRARRMYLRAAGGGGLNSPGLYALPNSTEAGA